MNLTALVETFINNLFPILLIGGVGFIFGKFLVVEARTIGRLCIYIFIPALVFELLHKSGLSLNEIASTMLVAASMILSIGLLAALACKWMGFERRISLSVIIAAMFGNNGNYGLPLVTFAFGASAAAYAGIYFVTSSILFNTLGIVIASLGKLSPKQALLSLFKIPMAYGVALAFILNYFQLSLPSGIDLAVSRIAAGAIPLMLVLLGVELSRVQWSQSLRAVGLGTGLRLIIGPLLGFLMVSAYNIQGIAFQAIMPQTGMPSAVSNTVLATEFELDSSVMTATVFISTLLSPFTLTPLLVLLGSR